MRKIETPEHVERRRKRNARIGSVVMLLILVVSSLGYAFMSSDSGTTNGGGSGKVYSVGDRWALDIGGGTIYFAYPPENVSEIIVDTNLSLQDYYQKPLYISSDSTLVGTEVSYNIGKFSERVQPACYGNCSLDYLIVFKESNQSRVSQKQNCIFIDGDLRALDAFLYKIFGY
jgi:hypothetical protein